MKLLTNVALAAALFASSLTAGVVVDAHQAEAGTRHTLVGSASYYGRDFHGRRTADGERFNMNAMTAAHKTLPFGTKVKVTNERNGRSVVVRINDRGPYHGGRIIDLSRAAAKRIGMINSGTAKVRLDIL
ncbi:septal ring lytic transglycosylase RlpA family protein [Jiella sp. M17.18]|uniref:septal ring lytic transglycosylase RlpA family protein n=1 Tax=Jiella sp. M17.18 TaxID=3234247 RepID=UPI0034DFD47E